MLGIKNVDLALLNNEIVDEKLINEFHKFYEFETGNNWYLMNINIYTQNFY